MIDVSRKSIVVTGGASGIGAAVCGAAIEQGAYVGVIDIDEDAGRTICEKLGDKAFFAAGNVESEGSVNEAISKLSSDMPYFNGAVCCAGVMPTRGAQIVAGAVAAGGQVPKGNVFNSPLTDDGKVDFGALEPNVLYIDPDNQVFMKPEAKSDNIIEYNFTVF